MFEFRDHHLSKRSAMDLAKRIALMLFGKETVLFESRASGDRYQIGTGNNYWLHALPDGRYRFNTRLSPEGKSAALQFMFTHYLAVVVLDTTATGGGAS